ncbi:MAG: hypothetical protein JW737_07715, partial [Acidobacteria bacterium]|nr:hypothetical protein [Acidobacteriota bacterium]
MKYCSSILMMLVLITVFLISVSLSFAEDKKVKSANTNKQEEDIQPPGDENWYETGDEDVYKFEINPITPKEGITGGILIYYGHFIKPPYKIENRGLEIYVNNLCVHPGYT